MQKYFKMMLNKLIKYNKSYLLPILVLIIFLIILYYFFSFLPLYISGINLDSSIQTLSQVLAIVFGVLLIGITVYLTSYDLSDSIYSIQGEIEQLFESIHSRFFYKGSKFNLSFLNKMRIKRMVFKNKDKSNPNPFFICRPYWDGVWYQVYGSPFKTRGGKKGKLVQIQVAHEIVICAYYVLKGIDQLRNSHTNLLSKKMGTEGSKWFLEDLIKFKSIDFNEFPDMFTLTDAKKVVSLAKNSVHYMWDELKSHSEELNWEPYRFSLFQLEFVYFFLWLTYLVTKFQSLRMINADIRFPGISTRFSEKTNKNLYFEELNNTRQKILEIRKRVIMVHGRAKYSMDLKRKSIFGIFLIFVSLFLILVFWPILRVASLDTRYIGFAILYSFGISAIIESSIFLVQMVWTERSKNSHRLC